MQYAPIANRYLDYVISCLPACVAGVSASVDDGQVSTEGQVQVELGTTLPSSSAPASGVLLAPVLATITQRRMRIVVASRTINMFRIIPCLEELFSRSLKLSTSLLMS